MILTAPTAPATSTTLPLLGVRVLAAIRSYELFGSERGNIEALKSLRTRGAEVRVAVPTLQGGGAVRRELERLGFTLYAMTFGVQWSKSFIINDPLHLPGNILAWIRCQLAFDRVIREFQPTHIQTGTALTFNFVEWAVRRHRLPLVMRLGDAPPTNSAVQLALWRRFVRYGQRAVAISDYIKRVSVECEPSLARKPFDVIYNLAPTPSQPPTDPEGMEPEFRHVVYVGQIIREKGVFDLLEAARVVSARHPDVKFHFIGGSAFSQSPEAELRRQAEAAGLGDRVRFHGWVANPRLHLARACVHVAPSLCAEALGNVVLEAKREGTPSVVYPSGGLPEMIRSGVDGLVCARPNVGDLVEGIEWVLASMRAHPGLRAAIQQDFHARFGPERFAAAWQGLFQRGAA